MKRIDAVKQIMDNITDELVITSTGKISREAFFIKDRPANFYVMGSMGASLGVGIGLALHTKRKVHVIAGDGDILMSLSTLVLMNKLKLPNLKLTILDNNCFEATGGQKTVSDAVDFTKICPNNCEVIKVDSTKSEVPRINLSHKEIMERFYNEVNKK
jgi:thiamine pyrophosphate-dependent acetolactate synthase large subunit-like protein